MSELLHLSSAPHDRGSLSTKTVMRDVLLALLPTAALGIWAHGWYAGFIMLVSIAAAVVTEYLFNLATKRGNTIGDASAVVTGLLLALTLPAGVPVYIPVLGSVFAILVVKCLFGGLGHNIMNPALAGRCFLLISFGAAMTGYTLDGVSAATPLAQLAAGDSVDLLDMILGRTSGVIGSSALGLVVGGIFLLLRRGITWEIPTATIGSAAIFLAIFGGHGLDPSYMLPQLLGGGLLIAVSLFAANIYPTFSAAFHHALFQFVSLVTTTGFATADSNQWTSFAVILLIFGSIVCACAGSTAGGIKTNRLVLAMKMMRTRLRQQQHPNAIIRIKLDGVIQENEALHSVMIFIVAYLMLILAGTVLGTMFGVDLMTSFSGSVASIGNVGPGFGQVGAMDNFSSVPGVFKISSSLLMLLGRLEIFGLIQLFFIKWWR